MRKFVSKVIVYSCVEITIVNVINTYTYVTVISSIANGLIITWKCCWNVNLSIINLIASNKYLLTLHLQEIIFIIHYLLPTCIKYFIWKEINKNVFIHLYRAIQVYVNVCIHSELETLKDYRNNCSDGCWNIQYKARLLF